MPDAVADWLGWLERYREPVDEAFDEFSFDIREVRCSFFQGDIEVNALFAGEVAAPDPDWVERSLRLLGYSLEDMGKLIAHQPPAALLLAEAGGWSAERVLRHVAVAGRYYLRGLGSTANAAQDATVWEDVRAAHDALTNGIRKFPAEKWGSVLTDNVGEQWTLRKVVRRSVAHVRDHYDQVARILRTVA